MIFIVHSADLWANAQPEQSFTLLIDAERAMRMAHTYGGEAWIQYPEGF
jgi:hypothetical protein